MITALSVFLSTAFGKVVLAGLTAVAAPLNTMAMNGLSGWLARRRAKRDRDSFELLGRAGQKRMAAVRGATEMLTYLDSIVLDMRQKKAAKSAGYSGLWIAAIALLLLRYFDLFEANVAPTLDSVSSEGTISVWIVLLAITLMIVSSSYVGRIWSELNFEQEVKSKEVSDQNTLVELGFLQKMLIEPGVNRYDLARFVLQHRIIDVSTALVQSKDVFDGLSLSEAGEEQVQDAIKKTQNVVVEATSIELEYTPTPPKISAASVPVRLVHGAFRSMHRFLRRNSKQT